eukprot:Selendium_serpulae@DN5685_c0_g1_i8.p1
MLMRHQRFKSSSKSAPAQCVVKGASRHVDMGEYAALITSVLCATQAMVWFDRVPSQLNPADGFSRGKDLAELKTRDISNDIKKDVPEATKMIQSWTKGEAVKALRSRDSRAEADSRPRML